MEEKINLKKELIDACIEKQSQAVESLKVAVNEAQNSANEYGAPKDRYDSYRTQLLRKRDMFAKQLQQALTQLEALHKISVDKELERVEFGAVVITSMQKIFVSVSLGKVELQGDEFYAVSPHVPIVQALNGKKAGENVLFNGRNIEIKEVF